MLEDSIHTKFQKMQSKWKDRMDTCGYLCIGVVCGEKLRGDCEDSADLKSGTSFFVQDRATLGQRKRHAWGPTPHCCKNWQGQLAISGQCKKCGFSEATAQPPSCRLRLPFCSRMPLTVFLFQSFLQENHLPLFSDQRFTFGYQRRKYCFHYYFLCTS